MRPVSRPIIADRCLVPHSASTCGYAKRSRSFGRSSLGRPRVRRRRQHAASRPADAARNGNDRRGDDADDDFLDRPDGHRHGVRASRRRASLGETRIIEQRGFVGEARIERRRRRNEARRSRSSCAASSPARAPPPKTVGSEHPSVRHLDAKIPGFLPENRARIDAMFDQLHGTASRVAVFDWDNTMMRNDIGDATFFYMLRHDLVLQPPARDWAITNKHLTPAARAELATPRAMRGEPGQAAADEPARPRAPTRSSRSTTTARRSTAARVRRRHEDDAPRVRVGRAAPSRPRARRDARHRDARLRRERGRADRHDADDRHDERSSPRGFASTSRCTICIDTLRAAGFDVWVVSASAQPLVEVVASHVGVGREPRRRHPHDDQRRQARLPHPRLRHRARRRRHGHHVQRRQALLDQPRDLQAARSRAALTRERSDEARRVRGGRLGHGSRDGRRTRPCSSSRSIATSARSCATRGERGRRWLVQPMFIEPLPPRTEPYSCDGLMDEDGKPIQGSLSPLR